MWPLPLPPLLALLATLGAATPVPPPGPSCAPGTPVANQSSPGRPDCELVSHNASCAAEPVRWQRRANFHPGSECHGENDPNGLMEFNGVYHLFMQDHNPMQLGGHLATRDFVHWRRLGIGIWNDQWYDKAAIWTFSATLVDGAPRIIYPGIAGANASNGDCGHGPGGKGCFTHALALPANLSDPWLVDWQKPAHLNPTVRLVDPTIASSQGINGENRDPSTAWKSSRGEWRYTDASSAIYSSWDFEKWRNIGNIDWGTGDCPDFFVLPPPCPGCAAEGETVVVPTHVRSNVGYSLGRYEEGEPNSTGSWTPLDPEQPEINTDGNGPTTFYAAKSFWDASKRRRIMWGWVRLAKQGLEVFSTQEGDKYQGFKPGGCPGVGDVMTNTNSLAREVTYDPGLQRLNYFPVGEMAALRGA
jgi:beta-fructofuranosidase